MGNSSDILIIGGGLAGLTNAVHLSKSGLKVTVIEKNDYPKHKVCGEYISNEVLPYLESLDIDPFSAGAKRIKRFQISTVTGKMLNTELPLGGFGISRYALDDYLFKKAKENGCNVVKDNVIDVIYGDDGFIVETKSGTTYQSKFVLGTYGKRSNLDVKLNRSFINKKSPFLGVKTHLKGEFPEDLVALHNFKGGYCGVSQVETGHLNVCFLANYETFQRYKNLDTYREEVVCKNPHLNAVFKNSEPVFETPLTISQVSFSPKSIVQDHILMGGDAAGMIHPLCGNGMAMAIHSAKILSDLLVQFFERDISSREQLEQEYVAQWKNTFRKRLLTGNILQTFFKKDKLSELAMDALMLAPKALPYIIKKTHGTPIALN